MAKVSLSLLVNLTWGSSSHDKLAYYPANIYHFPLLLGASPVVQLVRNPRAKAGDMRSIPGLGRSPGEGNGNPLQYSCLGNSMDR